jgi:DNA-directed RNA polymerase subunit RPC12/RpoP
MKYMLFCQHCSNKVFTDGKDLDYLYQVPLSAIPKRADGKDKSLFEQRKKIKCPECGYIFTIVKLKPDEVVSPKEEKEIEIP